MSAPGFREGAIYHAAAGASNVFRERCGGGRRPRHAGDCRLPLSKTHQEL